MHRYPGSYTIAGLLNEDAYTMLQHLALLDPDIGKA